MTDLMTTQEIAEYLRLKERKIYDLVRKKRIPCTRVTGKWLFPKAQIDDWLASTATGTDEIRPQMAPPPVIAGSHDPLLDWCVAESGCGLALMGGGSLDGLAKLSAGQARICGLHVFDPATGAHNVPAIRQTLGAMDVVAIEWAEREQGLVVAPGNPLGIAGLDDLVRGQARIILRQRDAGSRLLLEALATAAGLRPDQFAALPQPARSEIDVGLAVLDGKADTGMAIRAVARQLRLDFVPLHQERYDLVMRRRDYFEPPVQRLLAFARSAAAAAKAADLQGYDLAGLGTVHHNGP